MIQLLLLCLGFSLNKVGTFLIITLANKFQLFEKSNHRKIHKEHVSALGGISIFFSLWLLTFLFTSFFDEISYLFMGTSLLFVIGLWDDLKNINIQKRLLAQIIAAHLAYLAGFHFGLPFVLLNYSCTIFFILLMINGVNFIDGINGLAGSVGLVGISFFAISFYSIGLYHLFHFSLLYIAVLLGFLTYNFGKKAAIFMGDNGSTVLGYLMAVFSIKVLQVTAWESSTSFYILSVFTVIALPVLDLFAVVLIRLSKKQSPFKADRIHLHHLLTDSGKSHPASCQYILVWLIGLSLIFYYQPLPSFSLNLFLIIGSYVFIRYRYTFKVPAISAVKWDKPAQRPMPTPELNFE